MSKLIDGKAISKQIRQTIADEVKQLKSDHNLIPGLCVILVGEDPASKIYVRNKERACNEVGINSKVIRMNEQISEKELLKTIEQLNQ